MGDLERLLKRDIRNVEGAVKKFKERLKNALQNIKSSSSDLKEQIRDYEKMKNMNLKELKSNL